MKKNQLAKARMNLKNLFMLLILYQGVNCIRLFRRYKQEQMDELKAKQDAIEAERAENARMIEELKALKAQLESQQLDALKKSEGEEVQSEQP